MGPMGREWADSSSVVSGMALLVIAMLVPQSLSQPTCKLSTATGDLNACHCDKLEVSDRSWPAAVAYHSLVGYAYSKQSPIFMSLPEGDQDGPTISVLSNGRGIPAAAFSPPFAKDDYNWRGDWVNTAEGEWTVHVDPASLTADSNATSLARLQIGDGTCKLGGLSVYKPVVGQLALRLNFDKCSVGSGVHRVGIVRAIVQGEGSQSGLFEWMCSLMPHQACWPRATTSTTTATTETTMESGHVVVSLDAKYDWLGDGRCTNLADGPAREFGLGHTISECAQECVTEPGSTCAGFTFSSTEFPHCRIYSKLGPPSQLHQKAHGDEWGCYRMANVVGSNKHIAPTTTSAQAFMAPGQPEELVPTAVLHMQLGENGHRAVRRRMAPLVDGCGYEAFDWIMLDNSSQVFMSPQQWDIISQNLQPIPSTKATDGLQSTITTDRVCIDKGQGACAHKKANARAPVIQKEWWKLLLAAVASADIAIIATAAMIWRGRSPIGEKSSFDGWAAVPQNSAADEYRGDSQEDFNPTMSSMLQGSLVRAKP